RTSTFGHGCHCNSSSTLAISSALFPSFSSSIFGSSWSIPLLPSLRDIIPPFLLAVPKKKVSHSRKAMRSANKGLKDKQNLVHCPGCGSVKLAHHYSKSKTDVPS
ncbi:hypothetical protein BJV77DRAFT_971037, partial [Russula vinacea]